jgi:ligand-binding sensor protein
MAEAGQLPAIKVGRQWRFPADQIASWFQAQITTHVNPTSMGISSTRPIPADLDQELADLLPQKWLQIIQDTFAELLDVMLVVTDMAGNPLTRPSHPCGLFTAISGHSESFAKHVQGWRDVAAVMDLAPEFDARHLGLLCARGMIVVGTKIKGMVVAGCVAPDRWPPSPDEMETLASDLDVQQAYLRRHVNEVYCLEHAQRNQVLHALPRIATIIAYMAYERKQVIDRIGAIAGLAQLNEA